MNMATNNYFYCNKEPFFFDDRSESSTSMAFTQALAWQADMQPGLKSARRVTVYTRPKHRGAWDDLAKVVGESNLKLADTEPS